MEDNAEQDHSEETLGSVALIRKNDGQRSPRIHESLPECTPRRGNQSPATLKP